MSGDRNRVIGEKCGREREWESVIIIILYSCTQGSPPTLTSGWNVYNDSADNYYYYPLADGRGRKEKFEKMYIPTYRVRSVRTCTVEANESKKLCIIYYAVYAAYRLYVYVCMQIPRSHCVRAACAYNKLYVIIAGQSCVHHSPSIIT